MAAHGHQEHVHGDVSHGVCQGVFVMLGQI